MVHVNELLPHDRLELVDDEGGSKSNLDEAAKVLSIVNTLLSAGDLTPSDIGVITPYSGQVRLLVDLFDQAGGRDENDPYAGLEIKSVDGYQGREKEVIVLSTVRANENGTVGFLSVTLQWQQSQGLTGCAPTYRPTRRPGSRPSRW